VSQSHPRKANLTKRRLARGSRIFGIRDDGERLSGADADSVKEPARPVEGSRLPFCLFTLRRLASIACGATPAAFFARAFSNPTYD
jgi:hypothetical protein